MKKACRHCGEAFVACPRVKNQQYCRNAECQRARKREWHRRKLAEPFYQEYQQNAQRAWQAKNPGYWRKYRQEHPLAAERNRLKQRDRNRIARQTLPPSGSMIAKMDSIDQPSMPLLAGRYQMTRLDIPDCKTDSILVEIRSIPCLERVSVVSGHDCKEGT